jgi:hypothetical protein
VSATDRLYLTSLLPTLIVWGAHDPIIPVRHAADAHKAMPGSRLVIFKEAGHFPHCEVPDQFVEVLVDFMTSTAPAQLSEAHWRELLRAAPATPHAAEAEVAPGARLAANGA